mgnify:CR=1 FL=1
MEQIHKIHSDLESYIVYWVSTNGQQMKTSTLASSKENAAATEKYVYKDFKYLLRVEKGTIPFDR